MTSSGCFLICLIIASSANAFPGHDMGMHDEDSTAEQRAGMMMSIEDVEETERLRMDSDSDKSDHMGMNPHFDAYKKIVGDASTFCADGSEFAIFVKPGDSDKILINFEGGGFCGDFESCFNSIFAPNVRLTTLEGLLEGTGVGENAPSFLRGPETVAGNGIGYGENGVMFNERLVTADWTIVYVPYCTLDLGYGAGVGTYQNPADPSDVRQLRHNGLANTLWATNWVMSNFKSPEKVMLSGCSAGTTTAVLPLMQLEAAWPDASFYYFADSNMLISSSLTQVVATQWNAQCALTEILQPAFDTSDPEEYARTLTTEMFLFSVIQQTSATVIIYATRQDPIAKSGFVNPTIPGLGTLYPSDMYDVKFRFLTGLLAQFENVRLWLVDEYTLLSEAYPAGVFSNPELLGVPHCSANAGSFLFAFFDENTYNKYTREYTVDEFPYPYLGFRPDVKPAGMMNSVDWFNNIVTADSPADMPASFVCPTCTSSGGAGCDGNTGADFMMYNACGGCGDTARCPTDSDGTIQTLDIISELLGGKDLTTIIGEQLAINSFAAFPAMSYATLYNLARPLCTNLENELECVSTISAVPNQYCDEACNRSELPTDCPSYCNCAQNVRPS